jgi:hypothetical protein
MKIKSIIAAALLVASASSFAATYHLGTLGAGETYLSGSSTSNVLVANGSFLDIYNFSLVSLSDFDADATTLNFRRFQINNTTFGYTLFDSANTVLSTGNSSSGFSLSSLASGPYYLEVSGFATGANGGLYNGALTVTPVPEPETFAMLLAGLGLMGTIARRRRKAVVAA